METVNKHIGFLNTSHPEVFQLGLKCRLVKTQQFINFTAKMWRLVST